MEMVKFLAVKFAEENIDWTQWPEDVTATQDNYEVHLDGWKTGQTYTYGNGTVHEYCVGFDCEGAFKNLEEYDEGETCTRQEYADFINENPSYVSDIKAARETALKRIAELNEIAYNAVKEAIELSHSVDLPYSCSMPMGVADLDENSDWDSSRC
uniref:Uncharacterized protein n=2 Tax=unclassified bacterial viruses TaxID=12333 RepID=A0AAU6VYC7_9VIRU